MNGHRVHNMLVPTEDKLTELVRAKGITFRDSKAPLDFSDLLQNKLIFGTRLSRWSNYVA